MNGHARKYLSILPCLLGILLYLPSLSFDFTYDDFWQIHRNSHITDTSIDVLSQAINIICSPTLPGNLYRPLPLLTYLLQWRVSGPNPAAFHAANLLLYLILIILVGKLYERLAARSLAAFFALSIFAVHPVHLEAVASVVGRAELLALIFGIASLLHYLSYSANGKTHHLALGATFFVLATLSKESAYAFLCLTPLALWYQKTSKETLLRVIISFAFTSTALLLTRYFVLGASLTISEASLGESFENPLAALTTKERLVPATIIFGRYIYNLCLPFWLSADYSVTLHTLPSEIFSLRGLLWLFAFVLWAIATIRLRRTNLGFPAWWILISLFLTSNLVIPAGTLMADRLALSASVGFCWLLSELALSFRAGIYLLCIFIATSSYETYKREPIWANNLALFKSMTLDNPQSPKAFFNYGIELAHISDNLGAETSLRKTLELAPNYLPAMKAVADLLIRGKDLGRAEYFLKKILEFEPQNQKVQEQLRLLSLLKPGKNIAE